ncbi:MAG: four helix bundle protein [Bacteroidales bacterium]|nr:four helix bundle protein [Bacteroidales bacterium]
METSNFKKLNVWQKANDLALALYETSKKFQKKDSNLAIQLADCGVSLTGQIALAGELWSMDQKINHLEIANEKAFTAISLLNLSQRLEILDEEQVKTLESQCLEISHALLSWIRNCYKKLPDNQPAEQNTSE